jgi:hypothetical protein
VPGVAGVSTEPTPGNHVIEISTDERAIGSSMADNTDLNSLTSNPSSISDQQNQ